MTSRRSFSVSSRPCAMRWTSTLVLILITLMLMTGRVHSDRADSLWQFQLLPCRVAITGSVSSKLMLLLSLRRPESKLAESSNGSSSLSSMKGYYCYWSLNSSIQSPSTHWLKQSAHWIALSEWSRWTRSYPRSTLCAEKLKRLRVASLHTSSRTHHKRIIHFKTLTTWFWLYSSSISSSSHPPRTQSNSPPPCPGSMQILHGQKPLPWPTTETDTRGSNYGKVRTHNVCFISEVVGVWFLRLLPRFRGRGTTRIFRAYFEHLAMTNNRHMPNNRLMRGLDPSRRWSKKKITSVSTWWAQLYRS